jgi:tetratricopeptide (TPR) repeat protein
VRHPLKFLLCLSLSLLLAAEPVLADYRAASQYFARRDYISAAGAYFQAYGYPKGPGEKEKAEWGLAQSLQKLGFYYSASKYYSVIVRRGPTRNNIFFTKALEELGKINSTINLGQSHIVQLFKTRIDPAAVPGPARGFYFYYLGIEAFNRRKFEQAASYFQKVPSGSPYSLKATFHLGVISNLRGSHSKAISYFERVRASAGSGDSGAWVREQANLNIARVNYEVKRYRTAIEYYAQIPRDSDNWLQALFEAAWTFFMMQKHNNTLGTIHTLHSPFFVNRFFPESYILQAITFLRLCRYKQVKLSLAKFKGRYKGVFDDLNKMLDRHKNDAKGFFKLVYDYKVGSLNDYKRAWAILDSLSRTDVYKEAGNTIRFSDNELARLSRYSSRWGSSGLQDELSGFLRNKKTAAVKDAGKRLFDTATGYYAYLKELSDQTIGINTEMVLGRVDALREKLQVGQADKKANFIGGLQPLNVSQDLEYWPFEGEYWEDELGGYVYNIESLCGKGGDGGAKTGAKGKGKGDAGGDAGGGGDEQ